MCSCGDAICSLHTTTVFTIEEYAPRKTNREYHHSFVYLRLHFTPRTIASCRNVCTKKRFMRHPRVLLSACLSIYVGCSEMRKVGSIGSGCPIIPARFIVFHS